MIYLHDQYAEMLKDSPHMELEQLVSMLPVLYKNFWGKVRPDELSIISGNSRIASIPSPAPEPTYHSIQTVKKRLQQLTKAEIERLTQLCLDLPSGLELRSDFNHILPELAHG